MIDTRFPGRRGGLHHSAQKIDIRRRIAAAKYQPVYGLEHGAVKKVDAVPLDGYAAYEKVHMSRQVH